MFMFLHHTENNRPNIKHGRVLYIGSGNVGADVIVYTSWKLIFNPGIYFQTFRFSSIMVSELSELKYSNSMPLPSMCNVMDCGFFLQTKSNLILIIFIFSPISPTCILITYRIICESRGFPAISTVSPALSYPSVYFNVYLLYIYYELPKKRFLRAAHFNETNIGVEFSYLAVIVKIYPIDGELLWNNTGITLF